MLDRLTIERMRAIADGGPIAVALSGGGDSLSLMHLLAAEFGPRRLLALVVDHALRVGSSADAEKARQGAIQLGLQAEILTLDWRGAPSGAQQAAREARYRALCEAARRAAAPVIALGHTADDQAETVFMRAAAGSGWRGLAGMAAIAPSPVWPQGRGVAIARPLLGARRAALRDYLQTRAAQWLEDPANANPAFERVRVRQRLAALEAAGLDALRFARLADRLRPHVAAVDAAAADIIARAVRFEGPRIALDRTEWAGDRQARQRALALLLSAASGAARGPAPAALERLENRIANADFRGGSLAGARLSLKGGNILIDRDPGALLGRSGGPERAAPMDLPPGEVQVWDGRAALCVREPGWRVEPGKDGQPAFAHRDRAPESAPIEVEWLVEARVRHGLAFR